MAPLALLRWQWKGHASYHRSRVNLMLHLVVVPLFWLGTVCIVLGLLESAFPPALVGAVCIGVSLLVQGKGHKLEPTPPAPFTGPGNFVGRLLFEQFVTFPRFVLTGAWLRNFSPSGRDGG